MATIERFEDRITWQTALARDVRYIEAASLESLQSQVTKFGQIAGGREASSARTRNSALGRRHS